MTPALIVLGALIGLTLGALGAGGSILAVPVLVHVADLSVSAATATSLVAVGSAAIAAAIGQRRHVRLDVAAWFVPTGFVGAVAGARIGAHIGEAALLLGFSALLLVAASRMGARRRHPRPLSAAVPPIATGVSPGDRRRAREGAGVALAGAVVGLLTGLFGVGGGFVIVPALALAVGLSMAEAVATSLVIVALNAAIALVVRGPGSVDWPIALMLTVPMLVGSVIGARAARHIDPDRAMQAFAALLVVVALMNTVVVVV